MPLPYPTNPNLQAVPVYQPGRPIEEVARELGLPADRHHQARLERKPARPVAPGPGRHAQGAGPGEPLPGRQRLLPEAEARRQTRRDARPPDPRQRLQRNHRVRRPRADLARRRGGRLAVLLCGLSHRHRPVRRQARRRAGQELRPRPRRHAGRHHAPTRGWCSSPTPTTRPAPSPAAKTWPGSWPPCPRTSCSPWTRPTSSSWTSRSTCCRRSAAAGSPTCC